MAIFHWTMISGEKDSSIVHVFIFSSGEKAVNMGGVLAFQLLQGPGDMIHDVPTMWFWKNQQYTCRNRWTIQRTLLVY